MSRLRDAMAYVCVHYKHPEELSNARLTKTLYLADWRAALTLGRQITEVEWEFNHYGPFVHDVMYVARNDDAFEVVSMTNAYGSDKELIQIARPDVFLPELSEEDKGIIDEVMEVTTSKYWKDFIRLVYSTYPILTQSRYSTLDLVRLAEEYKANPALSSLPENV